MDSTVLNSSRAGQSLKRLKELVWNSAFSTSEVPRMQNYNLITRVDSPDSEECAVRVCMRTPAARSSRSEEG
jgi:hypothetical protein